MNEAHTFLFKTILLWHFGIEDALCASVSMTVVKATNKTNSENDHDVLLAYS